MHTFQEERYLNIQISVGPTPAVFKSAGVLTTATPPPPGSLEGVGGLKRNEAYHSKAAPW